MTSLTPHTVSIPSVGLPDRIAHRVGSALVRWSVDHTERLADRRARTLTRAHRSAVASASAADEQWTADWARTVASGQRRI